MTSAEARRAHWKTVMSQQEPPKAPRKQRRETAEQEPPAWMQDEPPIDAYAEDYAPLEPAAVEAFSSAPEKKGAKKRTQKSTRASILYDQADPTPSIDRLQDILRENDALFQTEDPNAPFVHIVRVGKPDVKKNMPIYAPGTLKTTRVTKETLLRIIADNSSWQKKEYKKNTVSYIPIKLPSKVLEYILGSTGQKCRLNILTGLTCAPVMVDTDGTILDRPGYDAKTGLFADFIPEEFPIPKKVTRAQAEDSLRYLEDVALSGFFFRSEDDRATAIAALLTTVAIPALSRLPIIAIDATERGSGKSALSQTIAFCATGTRAPTVTFVPSKEENEKMLFAAAMERPTILLIDNITQDFNGERLAQWSSEAKLKGRVLGCSSLIETDVSKSMLIANGNGLTLVGETPRRCLFISLNTKTEHPERIEYKRDLLSWLPDNWKKIRIACLTILRGYIQAGKPLLTNEMPEGKRVWQSFNTWNTIIRNACLWLNTNDPLATNLEIVESNPERDNLIAIFTAWFSIYGKQEMLLQEILKDLEPEEDLGLEKTDLRDLLIDYLSVKGNLLSTKSKLFSKKLKPFIGAIKGGYTLNYKNGRGRRGFYWIDCVRKQEEEPDF